MHRDFTKAQFRKAYERHGFKKIMYWLEDQTGTGMSFGIVVNAETFKIDRRASLAKALRDRDKERKKQAQREADHAQA